MPTETTNQPLVDEQRADEPLLPVELKQKEFQDEERLLAQPSAQTLADGADDAGVCGDGEITRIVVAVHGIGQQYRSDTIRAVARRFSDRSATPIPLLPLGYFSIGDGSDVRWSRLQTDDPVLKTIGFAEVFWADIPNELVRSNDTLEETKAWAQTVVSRGEAIYNQAVKQSLHDGARLGESDFRHGVDAIDTLVEGVAVLERLSSLADKAGIFKFEVGKLLRDYAGDVQTVTEFPQHRNQILYRFHTALNAIVRCYSKRNGGRLPEIHLVAHSEGTVISLLAQLQALSLVPVPDPAGDGQPQDGAWIRCLRGFMTIGSPIDKHIALWPGLWSDFKFNVQEKDGGVEVREQGAGGAALTLPQKIKWRNYFDYGDPVGFRLDAAVDWLEKAGCREFEFSTDLHDHGFSRYWLPGKAHVDYWKDAQLFSHFIETVVLQPDSKAPPPPPPQSKPLCDIFAKWMPYLLAFALHLAAVLVLFQALPEAYYANLPGLDLAQGAGALAVLLASVTVAARLPRIVRPEGRWAVLALAGLALGIGCVMNLPDAFADAMQAAWQGRGWTLPAAWPAWPAQDVLMAAALAVSLGAWVAPRARVVNGRKLMIVFGLAVAVALVTSGGDGKSLLTLKQAGACLGFAGLWWLGLIVFELALVWHRYIRQAVCVRTLRAWRKHRDAEYDAAWGLGAPRTPAPGPATDLAAQPQG